MVTFFLEISIFKATKQHFQTDIRGKTRKCRKIWNQSFESIDLQERKGYTTLAIFSGHNILGRGPQIAHRGYETYKLIEIKILLTKANKETTLGKLDYVKRKVIRKQKLNTLKYLKRQEF